MRPQGATPTTHILKMPLGLVGNQKVDLSSSVDNEWLCLTLLREFGLPVARCAVLTFGKQRVLAVERFDRQLHSSGQWWMRLPQENFCQALGLSSHLKYEADGGPGVRDIAQVLMHSTQAQTDLRHFMKSPILFWLLAAPDGHAKNFSIHILPQGRFKLAPLYDVMSIWPIEDASDRRDRGWPAGGHVPAKSSGLITPSHRLPFFAYPAGKSTVFGFFWLLTL